MGRIDFKDVAQVVEDLQDLTPGGLVDQPIYYSNDVAYRVGRFREELIPNGKKMELVAVWEGARFISGRGDVRSVQFGVNPQIIGQEGQIRLRVDYVGVSNSLITDVFIFEEGCTSRVVRTDSDKVVIKPIHDGVSLVSSILKNISNLAQRDRERRTQVMTKV